VNSYPPSIGPLALYKIDEFYETVDYAVIGVSQTCSTIVSFIQCSETLTLDSSPDKLYDVDMTVYWPCNNPR
jgi:hypothetical protein